MRIYIAVIALALTSSVSAQSLDNLNQLDHLNKEADTLDQLKITVEARARDTKVTCLKVLGRERFCRCLSQKLPMMWSFYNYVVIVTHSKQQNGYDKLTDNQKKAYDVVPSIREECVAIDAGGTNNRDSRTKHTDK